MQNVALITGASSGIGRELARIHAERGGDIIAVATSEERLNQLKTELESGSLGTEVMVIVKDLTAENAPQEVYNTVKAAGVEIDYLMNNAGFGGQGAFLEREWAQDRKMIQLNVIALCELTRLFTPDMVARGSGKVLNVSSTAALVPGPLQAVYFATKAFVTSFSNALASELEGTGVTVTALMPGATDTSFAATSGLDKTSLFSETVTAREVARDGYDAMMRGDLDEISGLSTTRRIQMFVARFMPKQAIMKQIRAVQQVRGE